MIRLVFIVLVLQGFVQGQCYGQTWFKRFDPSPYFEFSSDLVLAPDGGYLLAGELNENPNSSGSGTKDLVIIKLDQEGNMQWQTTLDYRKNGTSYSDVQAKLIYNNDGTILVVSSTHKNSSTIDANLSFWTLTSDGHIIQHTSSLAQYPVDCFINHNGELITAGDYYSCPPFSSCDDFMSFNVFDSDLNNLFEFNTIGTYSRHNSVFSAIEQAPFHYCLFGQTYYWTGDEWDAYCRLEVFDTQEFGWKSYNVDYTSGGAGFLGGQIVSVDEQYVILGYTNQSTYIIKKFDTSNGGTMWTRYLEAGSDFSTLISGTQDEGFIMARMDQDSIVLVKLDSYGYEVWKQVIPALIPISDTPPPIIQFASGLSAIHQTTDGGFIISGEYTPDWAIGKHELFVLKTDSNGTLGGWLVGSVKRDFNSNCIAEDSEFPLQGWIVEAKSNAGSFFATTDTNGHYALRLLPNEYEVIFKSNAPGYWNFCNPVTQIEIGSSQDTTIVDQSIGVQELCPLMSIDIGNVNVNTCQINHYQIQYCNYGTSGADTASIVLELDGYMEMAGSTFPFTQDGNIVKFYLGDIQPGDCGVILVEVFVKCNLPSGIDICLKGSIFPALFCGIEEPPVGVRFVYVDCRLPGQPFDPNDKRCSPAGIGDENMVNADTLLNYIIRFQNTGNDTAYQVVIRDILSEELEISTFKPGASSHPYEWTISPDHVLKFTFNQIELPDSNVNFSGSQGYISYYVQPKAKIIPGVKIYNNASIYFDYQPPILTNTVYHTIVKPVYQGNVELTGCMGEILDGLLLESDTILIDTFSFIYYDSIRFLDVKVLPSFHEELFDTICAGESYLFENQLLSETGTYQAMFSTQAGCDSIFTLHLSVLDIIQSSDSLLLCENDISYYTGFTYPLSGNYEEQVIFQNQKGCDSIILVSVLVYPEDTITVEKEFEIGTWYQGVQLMQDTVFIYFETTSFGCMRTIIELITVKPTAIDDIESISADINIYPNPATNELVVNFKSDGIVFRNWRIYGLDGSLKIQSDNSIIQVGSGTTLKIPVNTLPAGMYMLNLIYNDLPWRATFIKQ